MLSLHTFVNILGSHTFLKITRNKKIEFSYKPNYYNSKDH
jgi:hypothetical protein